MKTSRVLVKNTLSMLGATLIRMSASFVLVVFVARRLGSTGLGEFELVLTLFWLFQTIAALGIQPLLIREVAKDPERTGVILTNAGLLSLAAALLMACMMIVFSRIAGYSPAVRQAVFWMAGALILSTLSIVIQSIFIAWEKAELVLGGMTVESGVRLVTGVFVLLSGGGIVALSAVFAVTSVISIIIYLALTHRYITCLHYRIDLSVCLWMLRMVPAFAGSSIFNTIFWNANVIILSKMTSIEDVGLYGAPLRIIGMVRLILQSYKSAIQPVAARTYLKSAEEFRENCMDSLKYIFILVMPVCAGVTALAPDVLRTVFGNEFLSSTHLFRILTWLLIPYGITLVLATYMIAGNHQKEDMKINLIGMLFNVAAAFVLIGYLGATGAAWARLASVTLFATLQIRFVSRHLFRMNIMRQAGLIIASSVLMGSFAFGLSQVAHVLLTIPAAMGFYFLSLSKMGVLPISDLKNLIMLKPKSGNAAQ